MFVSNSSQFLNWTIFWYQIRVHLAFGKIRIGRGLERNSCSIFSVAKVLSDRFTKLSLLLKILRHTYWRSQAPGRAQEAIIFFLSKLPFFWSRLSKQYIIILADILELLFAILGLWYVRLVIRADNHLCAVIVFLTVVVAYHGLLSVDLRSKVLGLKHGWTDFFSSFRCRRYR